MPTSLTTVLFDLDGTLVDTAPDMAAALNRLLAEQGCEPLPYAQIRPSVSHGSVAMIRVGFGDALDDAEFERLRKRFLVIYENNLVHESKLFDGMALVLDTLESAGLNWGIVTNKPGWLAEPLLQQLSLDTRAACIVSGDSTEQRKPHPEPMLHACKLTNSEPARCVYVGDAQRDIEAGRAAGMKTVVASFGYIADTDAPETWGADGQIDSPAQLLDWIHDNA